MTTVDEPAIYEAVVRGDEAELSRLLPKLKWLTEYICLPLHGAAQRGHAGVLERLLNNGGTDWLDEDGRTPLHVATTKECAELLLRAGANLEARDYDLRTPIYFSYGETMSFLLLSGALVNVVNKDGNTPFHHNVCEGLEHEVEQLLRAGADIDAVDGDGKTALMIACTVLDYPSDMVKLLLRFGASADVQNGNGDTALCLVFGLEQCSTWYSTVKKLLAAGATFSEREEKTAKRYVKITRPFEPSNKIAKLVLEDLAEGASARLAALQPSAVAAAEARVRALDLNRPLETLQDAAAAAAAKGDELWELVAELDAWARALVSSLAARRAAAKAADDCFSAFRGLMEEECAVIRRVKTLRLNAGCRCCGDCEPEKSAVSARFAVAAARIAKCEAAAVERTARAAAAAEALARARARAEENAARVMAMKAELEQDLQ
jgi:hypothetical protein